MNTKRLLDVLLGVLTAASAALVLVGLYLALIGAPDADITGEVPRLTYRIIYFHIPTAWVGFLAFGVTAVFGLVYLVSRERWADTIALASAEIGTVFMLGVLVTGSIWARSTWNTWWRWEPRLTISLVQFLVYVGYLMLRSAVEDPARRARFASVYGIVAVVSVPINYLAIRWWNELHPLMFGNQAQQGGLGPNMRSAFFFCLIAFTVWYIALMWHRVRLERLHDAVDRCKQRVA